MLRAAARVASPRAPCCTGGRPGAKNRDARRGSELRGWRVVPKRDSKYLVAEEGPRKGAPAFSATGEEARAVQRGSDESAFAEENMENNASTSKPPDAALATLVAYCGQEDGVSSGADAHRALRDLPCPKISTVDKHFLEKLGVNFRWGLRDDANLDELNDLFNSVGFPRRDTTRLRRALVNSRLLIWIVVANKKNKSSGVFVGQVIGFARCTSDGVFNATIWDVVVCPKWQGCGLGKAMVERLTQKLIQLDIQNVSLYAEPAVVGLYQKCGFEGGTCGMAFRHARRSREKGSIVGGGAGPKTNSDEGGDGARNGAV